jgi:hypothetical protein
MQNEDEMFARGEKIVDVNLARRSNDVVGLQRSVGAVNDRVQLH